MKNRKLILTTSLAITAFGFGAIAPLTAQADMDDTYQWRNFSDVDVDRSGYLEGGEYQSYAFGMADWDNDGYLEDTEWSRYTTNFYDPWELDYDSYSYIDSDGDGYIDYTEFNEYDAANGLYDSWDYDNDNLIGEEDWDQVTSYYYDAD